MNILVAISLALTASLCAQQSPKNIRSRSRA
jgi:hypothetical protein